MKSRVLTIAGADSGGGAGIQADIKTITALGGYGASAITALTAQNTLGVFGILDVPVDFIRQQITLVLDDIGADAIKTGMLHKASVIEVVAATLKEKAAGIPFVLDPVMVAKGGEPLLERDAIDLLKTQLLPLATIVTPNLPEAELLTGLLIGDVDGMVKAARLILKLGAKAVLVKGGHLAGDTLVDVFCTEKAMDKFESPRIHTRNTHGTGCTLASAIATGLAQKMTLLHSVERARRYVHEAIRTAQGLGQGHGPLNHGHTVQMF